MISVQENKVKEGSEGEQFISEFLEENRVDFNREVKLTNLVSDSVPYRIADFFLPQYKVYIEFFGRWNTSEEHKKRYREKRKVYEENKIPCIYLYPENLGILNFLFERRLRQTLKKYGLRWQLFRFNRKKFQEKAGVGAIILGALIFYVAGIWWRVGLGLVLIYHIYDACKKTFAK